MTAETTRRPRSVTAAVVLVMLGTLVTTTAATGPGEASVLALLLMAVSFWFAVRAGRGKRTARTAVTCLTAVVFVLGATFAFEDALYGGFTLLLGAFLAVPGLVLLYRPAAEEYVRARERHLRTGEELDA
ncbi:hypothetical protein L1I79_33825 [Strepomyces sp. STD 3.1]|uniref:hypothetical protein n=1 Tax=Streptomyces sp. NPDC058985 TaxID=3346684 RepID=UPI001F1E78DF|nr:hypothetical protein [Streptomyces sp. STD 3.1]